MPHEFPDDFESEILRGETAPFAYADWLETQASDEFREHVDASMEAGLSLEWAILAAEHDVAASPEDWDRVLIQFDHAASNWDVYVDDVLVADGISMEAGELIWDDLYYVAMDYEVDIDKEY